MIDENDKIIWIIIIIFNFLVYGLCCFFIIKKKNFSAISIRSPTLLLCTIISNLVMTLTIILHEIIDVSFISIFYYIFRLMMVISIILRYERILSCYKYNKPNQYKKNIEKFAEKRYLLQEKYYVKIFIILFCAFFITILIIDLVGINSFRLFYDSYDFNKDTYKLQLYVWIILNFLEIGSILTYIIRIYDKQMKFFLKYELYIFLIFLFISSNFISFSNLYRNFEDFEFTFVSLVILYLCLSLNGYIPIFLSFFSKDILSYEFVPKLMNNFYLFLTNKECYKEFYLFLLKSGDNSIFHLKLYTHIMKYKLDFTLKISNEQLLREALDIYSKYFEQEGESIYVDQESLLKIKNKCKNLNKDRAFNSSMFDDGLKYSYNELYTKFNEFRKTNEFKYLSDRIYLDTLAQCKMCNTGLINKF